MNNESVLQVNTVSKRFGGLQALKDVKFDLAPNEILGLIGPNGAGKTTLFNVIAGVFKPDSGSILYQNKDVTKFRPDKRCKIGIARTFQITKPFNNMNLVDNVSVGAYFGKQHTSISSARKRAEEILDFVGMGDLLDVEAKNLSIGNRKKLELARALATEPEVLLLDEVIGGLTPTEGNEVVEIIKKIKQSGVSIIMIEHVMKAVMGVSDRMIVLNYGQILAEGTPKEIAENPQVIEAYLGGVKHA
ncbi:ABC transporter ATP-binding protein [Neobacillus mesonae]|uniref:ABC transporter ATP-binding protein n=1 Tax=Neobacillus mesonae TaxID=1193713 RepID=A0A3Q9QUG8_9BACI|nr:ABC transporter ATP-binding protein [Neobacillus mesonae]AZU62550.1 ABC transporter ATP-binding protein [Neobacillus mesonae]